MANLQNGFYQVNLGTNPNDGTGDSFRDAFAAENYNWALLGNTGLASTTLYFNGSNITAAAGTSLNLRVSNGGFVGLGNAGTSSIATAGNILIGGGLTDQFLRAVDDSGRVYWSGGAAGSNTQLQFNNQGYFAADPYLTFDYSTGILRSRNLLTVDDAVVGRDLTVSRNANIQGQLTSNVLNVTGDATVYGNLTVWKSINDVTANTIELNAFVLALANNTNSVSMLNSSGITWGNTGVLSTADTPTIRFLDLSGTGNINQDLLRIYPGLWTGSAYFGVAAPSNVANIRPGNINFGPDVTVTFESAIAAARFSNLQADVFASPLANIVQLNGNYIDLSTTEGGLSPDTRLLQIRNLSTTPSNIGLQIINQSFGSNIGWDIYTATGTGALVLGENTNPDAAANVRVQITTAGNVSLPYYPTSGASNNFIGFGPGDDTHAGLRYTGLDSTLSLEATGAIDQLQFNTGGATRVTILGGVGNATAGFVGVGTTAPVSPVQVLGTVDGNRLQSGLTLSRTGLFGGSFTLGVDNSNNQFFIANTQVNNSLLVINSQGNVGLACTAPTVGLDVAGAGRFKTMTGTDAAMTLSGNSNIQTINLQFADSNGTPFWAASYRAHTEYDDFWIYQNGLPNNPHLVLAYNEAKVGINTIDPLANLHVSSTANTNTAATIWAESTGGALVEINARPQFGSVGTRNNFPLALQVNSINVMTLATDRTVRVAGNVYLGNSTSNSTANISDSTVYFYGNGRYLAGIVATGGGGGNGVPTIEFTANATANNQQFTNSYIGLYTSNSNTSVYVDGIYQAPATYEISGNTLTYNRNLNTNQQVTIGASSAGGSSYGNADVAAYLASNANVSIVTTANIQGSYILGNGAFLTGISGGAGNYSNANVAAYLPTYTGNVGTGAGWIFGNGAFLTGLPAGYSNANVANYLASNANITILTTGAVTANSYSGSTGNVFVTASANIWTFDNTGNLILPANTFAVKYANGEQVPLATGAYGNTQVQGFLESNAAVNVIIQYNVVAAQILPQSNIGNAANTANVGAANLYWTNGFIANIRIPAGATLVGNTPIGNGTLITQNQDNAGIRIVDAVTQDGAEVVVGQLSADVITSGPIYSSGYNSLGEATTLFGTANRAAGAVSGDTTGLLWVSNIANATGNTLGNLDGLAAGSQLSQVGVDALGVYIQYTDDLGNTNALIPWNFQANSRSTFPGNLYLGIVTSDGNPANVNTGSNFIYANIRNTTGLVISDAAPVNASAPGYPGQIAYANGFVYVCIAANTWQRANLSSW